MSRPLLFLFALVLAAGGGFLLHPVVSSTTRDCPAPTFVRDAAAEWTTVVFEGISVDIPYSAAWRVDDAACLWGNTFFDTVMYKVSERHNDYGETWQELAFGRPAHNVTSIGHEYRLTHTPGPSPYTTFPPSAWSCLDASVTTPQEVVVDGVTGWRYFDGGAKWCDIVFTFAVGDATFTLARNLEPMFTALGANDIRTASATLSEIDAEMARIVTSIRE